MEAEAEVLGKRDRTLKVSGCNILYLLLMDKVLHDLKDSKLWELWYIPYNG